MLLRIGILLFLIVTAYGHCPEFLQQQTACTCENYYDGAIVKCNGPEGPAVVEKMKAAQTDVRELALENANIVEIGPRAFKNLRLKKLTLDNNKIKNIHKDAFKGLETSLMELSVASNKLPMVPTDSLEGLRALNVLSLKCNQIQDLNYTAFRRMPALIEVNLACNQICDISADAMTEIKNSLQNLILDDNCLKKIPAEALDGMEYLIALHLKHNEISALNKTDFRNLRNLIMLTLNGNKIASIDKETVVNTSSIRYIYLNENQVSSIEPGTMKQFNEAEIVDLSYNNLPEITLDMFTGMEHLQHLNLEANMIKDIAPGAFSTTPLLLLWLPHNCLTSVSAQIFQGTPFLKQVSLAHNNIRVVQALSFAHLANLHTLDLSNNKIKNIQPSALMGTDFLTVRVQENPMVCNQDGFHVMNGHEAINLTTEANEICKTDYHNDIQDKCPKRPDRPIPAPCCNARQTTTTTTTEAPTEAPTPLPRFNLEPVGMTESQPMPMLTPRQRFLPEPMQNSEAQSQEVRRKLNMERFWRLARRPESSPVAQLHSRMSHEVGTLNSPRFRALNFKAAEGARTIKRPDFDRAELLALRRAMEQQVARKQKFEEAAPSEFNEDAETESVQKEEEKAETKPVTEVESEATESQPDPETTEAVSEPVTEEPTEAEPDPATEEPEPATEGPEHETEEPEPEREEIKREEEEEVPEEKLKGVEREDDEEINEREPARKL